MFRVFSVLLLNLLVFNNYVQAVSFKDIVNNLDNHASVESLINRAKSVEENSSIQGSWGDPSFKLAAKNFPKDTLKKNETAMTGIELAVSQKISLTRKYGNIEDSFLSLANALSYTAKDRKEALTKSLWQIVIIRRKVISEIAILKENVNWISKILKISKKLYTNGRSTQQALLDLQIRKSELESDYLSKKLELKQVDDHLSYLYKDDTEKLDFTTVPWKLLNTSNTKRIDFKELAFKEKIAAQESSLNASKLNYVPDITFSLGYTKRSNLDDKGDFVGASISFPLPFSATKYAGHSKETFKKYEAVKNYRNYQKNKRKNTSILQKEIKSLKLQIRIIEDKTIKFAKNSRTITSKSYGLGNSTYLELLQSELKLQKILEKRLLLVAKRDMKKITLKYTMGEALYE